MPGAAVLSLIHLCNCPLTMPHLPGPDVLSLGDASVLNCTYVQAPGAATLSLPLCGACFICVKVSSYGLI